MKVAQKYKYKSSIGPQDPEPFHLGETKGWELGNNGYQVMAFDTVCGKRLQLFFHNKKKSDKLVDYDKKKHRKDVCKDCAAIKIKQIKIARAQAQQRAFEATSDGPRIQTH